MDDLADISGQARARYLEPGGSLILRGGSAGAWLAMKTALTYPASADEVIAFSGSYFFEEGGRLTRRNSFFSPNDSITEAEIANCGSTYFHVFHGTADEITPYEDTTRLTSLFSDHDCEGALYSRLGEGHDLAEFFRDMSSADNVEAADWYHGLNPAN